MNAEQNIENLIKEENIMLNQKKISNSGNVGIPIAMRRDMCLQPKDAVNVQMQDGSIVITPVSPRCMFCGASKDNMKKIYGRHVCGECVEYAASRFKDDKAGDSDE